LDFASALPALDLLHARDGLRLLAGPRGGPLLEGRFAAGLRAGARTALPEALLERIDQSDDLRALRLRRERRHLAAFDLGFYHLEHAAPILNRILLGLERFARELLDEALGEVQFSGLDLGV